MSDERWSGVPVAWAAVAGNGQPLWLGYDRPVSDLPVNARVVPLHLAPRLTDAEREAVEWAVRFAGMADCNGKRLATLRSLLERMGGDE